MTGDFPEKAELRSLLDSLCEESITAEQMRRFEELVLARPEAEAFYVQFMSFQADLIQTIRGLPNQVETVPAASKTGGRRRWMQMAGVAAAMAAAVLLAFAVWPSKQSLPTTPEIASEDVDDTIAVLLQTHRAAWEETGLPTRPGSPLPPGRLVLKSGFAQIEFYSGATVILEGPAEFRLVSRTEAYCARGRLRANVPAQAQGFTIGSPKLDLIDRGTEFGLDVGEKTQVHVFRGKVDVYDPHAGHAGVPQSELTTGQGISLSELGAGNSIRADSDAFLTAGELAEREKKDNRQRQRDWSAACEELRRDPALTVYYTFQTNQPWSRTLLDESRARETPHDGAIVGCTWGPGRWTGKQGLEFKRVSDRVRFTVPGEFESLTLAAWIRADALPNQNNSLMMADGWDPGAPHWQIGSDGAVILGIRGPLDYKPEPNVRGGQYKALGVMTPERLSRWVHLAVVYDRAAGEVIHYVDGQPAARLPIAFDIPLRIGDAVIGNWNVASYRVKSPIRNFHGCIDEFALFSRPLTGPEIERLYAQGQPR